MRIMNERVKILKEEYLYKGWSVLKNYYISYVRSDGKTENQVREIYNSGDGAAVLLYNVEEKKIILIRQFRLPALLNGHPSGFMIEACAGMLDNLNPEAAIIKEIEEETGYKIKAVKKIYEAFATPGAHMEKIHFYIAEYKECMKINEGGGELREQEDIEILEYDFEEITPLLKSKEMVDAKTIILLQWACLNIL